jgi:hypothetical protein
MLLVRGGSGRLLVLPFWVPFWETPIRLSARSLMTCRLGLSGAGSVGIVSLPLVSHFGSSTPNFN